MCCKTSSGMGKGCPAACGKVGHLLASLLWLLGLLSLVAALVAMKQGAVWGLDVVSWYLNVMAFSFLGLLSGVNALFHAKKKGSCGGACGDEKGVEAAHVCGDGKCEGHK
ncbi:MAG: hypothetical protein Q7S16_02285 [bacterium]|nr:hypothetical protein [bacterium]